MFFAKSPPKPESKALGLNRPCLDVPVDLDGCKRILILIVEQFCLIRCYLGNHVRQAGVTAIFCSRQPGRSIVAEFEKLGFDLIPIHGRILFG